MKSKTILSFAVSHHKPQHPYDKITEGLQDGLIEGLEVGLSFGGWLQQKCVLGINSKKWYLDNIEYTTKELFEIYLAQY